MIRAGYKLMYVPDAIVWHGEKVSIENSPIKLWYFRRNKIRFVFKNFDISHIPIFLIIYCGGIVYSSIKTLRKTKKNI